MIHHGDWALKSYSITYGAEPFDPARFAEGVALLVRALPRPAITPQRLGVGFVIQHQGNQADYLILGWWDRENELPLRVFVRDVPTGQWRAAEGSESICVWDLGVIWAERQAYVSTVLSDEAASDRDAYLLRDATVGVEEQSRSRRK